jgi:hypothetical protein
MPVELITQQGTHLTAHGGVAARLIANNFNVNSLRVNGVLRFRDWILMDRTVIDVARQRLTLTQELVSRGLVFPVPGALGVTRIEWERMSDMGPAEVDMSGLTPGRNDGIEFDLQGMPLPIIHKDFHLNIRHLEASRRGGTPLDTAQAALSTRIVSETIEGIILNGYAITSAGTGPIYGLLNHPNRNTGSLTHDWSLDTTPGDEIVKDLIEMIGVMLGDNMFGPYGLLLPLSTMNRLSDDYKANSDRSILERLGAIPNVSFILPVAQLAAPNVVLFQLSSDVIDMIDGIQPTLVQWEAHGGMQFCFKVLAIMFPRVRSDYKGQSGIVHYS